MYLPVNQLLEGPQVQRERRSSCVAHLLYSSLFQRKKKKVKKERMTTLLWRVRLKGLFLPLQVQALK